MVNCNWIHTNTNENQFIILFLVVTIQINLPPYPDNPDYTLKYNWKNIKIAHIKLSLVIVTRNCTFNRFTSIDFSIQCIPWTELEVSLLNWKEYSFLLFDDNTVNCYRATFFFNSVFLMQSMLTVGIFETHSSSSIYFCALKFNLILFTDH